jgi:hypothetical protein
MNLNLHILCLYLNCHFILTRFQFKMITNNGRDPADEECHVIEMQEFRDVSISLARHEKMRRVWARLKYNCLLEQMNQKMLSILVDDFLHAARHENMRRVWKSLKYNRVLEHSRQKLLSILVDKSLYATRHKKMKRAWTSLKYNRVLGQLGQTRMRIDSTFEYRQLSIQEQTKFDSLLTQLRQGLEYGITATENYLSGLKDSALDMSHCQWFLTSERQKIPDTVKRIKCAWEVQIGRVPALTSCDDEFEKIRKAIHPRIEQERIDLEHFIERYIIIRKRSGMIASFSSEWDRIQDEKAKRMFLLAFAMGSHDILGRESQVRILDCDLIHGVLTGL